MLFLCFSFYFEITVHNLGSDGSIGVGFWELGKPMRGELGGSSQSVGFSSDSYVCGGSGRGKEAGKQWKPGDKVGAGWDLRTGKVWFTQNGNHLLEYCTLVYSGRGWVPVVMIDMPGVTWRLQLPGLRTHGACLLQARLDVNFGQVPFAYNFAGSKYTQVGRVCQQLFSAFHP